jgi:hypothetical protein
MNQASPEYVLDTSSDLFLPVQNETNGDQNKGKRYAFMLNPVMRAHLIQKTPVNALVCFACLHAHSLWLFVFVYVPNLSPFPM